MNLKISTQAIQQKELLSLGFDVSLKNVPIAIERIESFTRQKFFIAIQKFGVNFIFSKETRNDFLTIFHQYYVDEEMSEIQNDFLKKENIGEILINDLLENERSLNESELKKVYCFQIYHTFLKYYRRFTKEESIHQRYVLSNFFYVVNNSKLFYANYEISNGVKATQYKNFFKKYMRQKQFNEDLFNQMCEYVLSKFLAPEVIVNTVNRKYFSPGTPDSTLNQYLMCNYSPEFEIEYLKELNSFKNDIFSIAREQLL